MEKSKLFPFYKMTGGGNDFVLLDNREQVLAGDYSKIAEKLCNRKFSIGADGLLILEKSKEAHFRMVYHNSDGSRAEMCGNGARCIARYAALLKIAPSKLSFVTDIGIVSAEVKGESVKLKMVDPKDLKLDFPLKLEDGKEIHLSSINTGVPHAVLLVTDLEKTEVEYLGRAIRFHKAFVPQGTNVNFVLHKGGQTLFVRTYERGVEAETLACGTGVTASALVCATRGLVESPVSCTTKGGEILKVYFQFKQDLSLSPSPSPSPSRGEDKGEGEPSDSAGRQKSAFVSERKTVPNAKFGLNKEELSFHDVYLEGPATVCFRGEVEI